MNMELSKEKLLEIAERKEKCVKCDTERNICIACDNFVCANKAWREEIAFYEKVKELLQADVEGRLVVLPCAVAEEVEYKSAIDEGKVRKGKVIAISMLLSESVRRMEMQVMIESGAVIGFEKNDFEKGVLRRGKEESEAALEKMGGGEE